MSWTGELRDKKRSGRPYSVCTKNLIKAVKKRIRRNLERIIGKLGQELNIKPKIHFKRWPKAEDIKKKKQRGLTEEKSKTTQESKSAPSTVQRRSRTNSNSTTLSEQKFCDDMGSDIKKRRTLPVEKCWKNCWKKEKKSVKIYAKFYLERILVDKLKIRALLLYLENSWVFSKIPHRLVQRECSRMVFRRMSRFYHNNWIAAVIPWFKSVGF